MKATIDLTNDHSKIVLPYGKSGIYFLYYQEGLVYIGKASNLGNRLAEHFNDTYHSQSQLNPKRITKATYFCIKKEDLKKTELALIKKHKPRLNYTYNSDNYYCNEVFCYGCWSYHEPITENNIEQVTLLCTQRHKELLEKLNLASEKRTILICEIASKLKAMQ